jgi:membrane fusion protein, heavy metal efflux system
MDCETDPATILVVEDDAVLGQVLGQVLTRDGHVVRHALNSSQAIEVLGGRPPRLVLLDAGLRDGSGLHLAETIRTQHAGVPMILLTKSTQEVAELPAWAKTRVLTKSTDLPALRREISTALVAGPEQAPPAAAEPLPADSPGTRPTPLPGRGSALRTVKEFLMNPLRSKPFKTLGAVLAALVGLLVLVGLLAAANGTIHIPGIANPELAADSHSDPPPDSSASTASIELVEGKPHTLLVPADVRVSLGIRKDNVDAIAAAQKPTRMRPLLMPGSTALDPTRIFRIRARFAPSPSSAECIELGQITEDPRKSGSTRSVFRELRSGDRVIKGNLLAVFYSVDVGNKKNDLIDAIYQLKLDDIILKRWEQQSSVVPEVQLWTQRRTVNGDINAIERAVSMLRAWGISEEDIQTVRTEAEQVKPDEAERRLRLHDRAEFDRWARVEIKAPADGIIIERNLALHEIVVDNTTNLFQIADLNKLFVAANCQEDDLPQLEALRESSHDLIRWTVKTVGSPPLPGYIDDISYLIDPNQHTAVVKGYIENKGHKLRGGQFISATVDLPPPENVVEIPVGAVIEDGQQAIVFVEADAAKQEYTMRRVEVTNRFQDRVFVRSKPFAQGESGTTAEGELLGLLPRQALVPGDRVVLTAVNELKGVVLERESDARAQAAQKKEMAQSKAEKSK